MPHILIVSDDNEEIRRLASALLKEGFTLSRTTPEQVSGELTLSENADLVILNTSTSTHSVPEISQLLRENAKTRELSVIALLREEELEGYDFSLGINDFVVGPYNPAEVIARTKQSLWRKSKVDGKDIIRAGDMVIDLAKYEVSLAGKAIELTFKEYELLKLLASNKEKVFTREALLNKIWGYDYFGGTRTVDVHIRRLRSKIEDKGHSFIETVRNVGYKFKESR